MRVPTFSTGKSGVRGNPVSQGKSGVVSSFLPEKMHRLRITRREKTNRLRITRVLNRSVGKMHLFGKDADFEAFQRVMIEAH